MKYLRGKAEKNETTILAWTIVFSKNPLLLSKQGNPAYCQARNQ